MDEDPVNGPVRVMDSRPVTLALTRLGQLRRPRAGAADPEIQMPLRAIGPPPQGAAA